MRITDLAQPEKELGFCFRYKCEHRVRRAYGVYDDGSRVSARLCKYRRRNSQKAEGFGITAHYFQREPASPSHEQFFVDRIDWRIRIELYNMSLSMWLFHPSPAPK